ncbi:2-octaprenyl-6-methoxyphenyl hydroxylase [Methylomarinum vadi]|uniref:2-octaprenyl-6-methoxyphenyl hydroxylase n=1 Tax=Methylomarinum vadi TaxID=438855 RepID=UPI0004DF32A7|nr:2-octaprenyl-6-methoxyphenyl hydroxylase [Methylomarinum vadi]
MQHDYDILIAGAGLAGNCLALALKDSGLKVAIVETFSREQVYVSPAGDRALALAAGTVHMLEALNVWQGVADRATAITDIHISDRGHFGKARLSAQRQGVDALGYVIRARDIEDHVAALVEQADIEQFRPARVAGLMSGLQSVNVSLKQDGHSVNLAAALLVGADGGNSSVRKLLDIPQQVTEYGQTALVTTVRSSLPHHNTAYERFTASGPLALLPQADNLSAVVWTRKHEEAEALMAGGEAEFIEQLQDCFGYRLGELTLAAPRRAFPLSLIRAQTMVSGRTVIIGNAVHQLHPVAGQGFNLGLRDVVQLAEMVLDRWEQGLDIGGSDLLGRYAELRQQDHDHTIAFTDNVVKIFSSDWLALAALRNSALTVLDHIPFAKTLLARHAMGLAQRLPRVGSKRG